jgi:hypothetical protein
MQKWQNAYESIKSDLCQLFKRLPLIINMLGFGQAEQLPAQKGKEK